MRAFCHPLQKTWTCTVATPVVLTSMPAALPFLARLYSTASPARPLPPRPAHCRVRSVVGRSEVYHIRSLFAASAVPPSGGSVRPLGLAEDDGAAATAVEYDLYGTPVGGPLLSHAFVDQLKIYASLLLALALTKFAFDALRFDMIYYDLWKVGLRWSSLWRERLEYYISTAMVGLSLLCGVGANFIALVTLLGRRQLGLYVLRRLARRAVLPITRK